MLYTLTLSLASRSRLNSRPAFKVKANVKCGAQCPEVPSYHSTSHFALQLLFQMTVSVGFAGPMFLVDNLPENCDLNSQNTVRSTV